MKRFLAGLIVGIVLATAAGAWAQTAVVRLFVDGQEIAFPEAPPQIINGRVMVPARPLAEALGGTVRWDAAQKAVLVTSPEPVVVAAPVEPAPAPEPAENICPTPETSAEDPAPAPEPAAEEPQGPVAASVGEWLQFTNYRMSVTEVRYAPGISPTRLAPKDHHFAIVAVAIQTGQVSVDPLRRPGAISKWVLRSGESMNPGYGIIPYGNDYLRPGEDRVVEFYAAIPFDATLAAILVQSAYPEDAGLAFEVMIP